MNVLELLQNIKIHKLSFWWLFILTWPVKIPLLHSTKNIHHCFFYNEHWLAAIVIFSPTVECRSLSSMLGWRKCRVWIWKVSSFAFFIAGLPSFQHSNACGGGQWVGQGLKLLPFWLNHYVFQLRGLFCQNCAKILFILCIILVLNRMDLTFISIA